MLELCIANASVCMVETSARARCVVNKDEDVASGEGAKGKRASCLPFVKSP